MEPTANGILKGITGQMNETLQIATTLTALATAAGQVEGEGNHHYVMVPPNYTAKDITDLVEKAQTAPNRKRGTVTVKDLDSLLLYCNDQNQDGDSPRASTIGYIYADPDQRRITAVFNDNRAPDMSGWRDHRAEYKAEYTPEFANWMGKNKHQFGQTEFAEFIEDNMADITVPAASAMLEMATTISAKTDINFSSAKRLQNGQVQLQYTENINASAGANGAMEIPKEFNLGLRIFKNGAGYKINARLKYRLHGGAIKFWYELDRVERAIEDAFSGYVATLREQSGYVVLLGTP